MSDRTQYQPEEGSPAPPDSATPLRTEEVEAVSGGKYSMNDLFCLIHDGELSPHQLPDGTTCNGF